MINSATFTAYEVGDENLGDLLLEPVHCGGSRSESPTTPATSRVKKNTPTTEALVSERFDHQYSHW